MNAYQDPSDVPDPQNATAPECGWEDEMTMIATVMPSLPPELREPPPTELEELPLDDDPTEAVDITPPTITPPAVASGTRLVDNSAPSTSSTSKRPTKKRRGLAIVGAVVGGLALLGVVAVAGLAVVAAAGVGGAYYLLSPVEETAQTSAKHVEVVGGEAISSATGEAIAPAVEAPVGLAAAVDSPDVPDEIGEAGRAQGAHVEALTPQTASSTTRVTPRASAPSRQTSLASRPSPVSHAPDVSDEPTVVEDKAVPDRVIKVKDGEATLDVAAAGRALSSRVAKKSSSFTVRGDGVRVQLVKGNKRVSIPGPVPAGRYEIEATFDGQEPFMVGSIRVKGGESFSVSCDASVGSCSAE